MHLIFSYFLCPTLSYLLLLHFTVSSNWSAFIFCQPSEQSTFTNHLHTIFRNWITIVKWSILLRGNFEPALPASPHTPFRVLLIRSLSFFFIFPPLQLMRRDRTQPPVLNLLLCAFTFYIFCTLHTFGGEMSCLNLF